MKQAPNLSTNQVLSSQAVPQPIRHCGEGEYGQSTALPWEEFGRLRSFSRRAKHLPNDVAPIRYLVWYLPSEIMEKISYSNDAAVPGIRCRYRPLLPYFIERRSCSFIPDGGRTTDHRDDYESQ